MRRVLCERFAARRLMMVVEAGGQLEEGEVAGRLAGGDPEVTEGLSVHHQNVPKLEVGGTLWAPTSSLRLLGPS